MNDALTLQSIGNDSHYSPELTSANRKLIFFREDFLNFAVAMLFEIANYIKWGNIIGWSCLFIVLAVLGIQGLSAGFARENPAAHRLSHVSNFLKQRYASMIGNARGVELILRVLKEITMIFSLAGVLCFCIGKIIS